MFSCKELIAMTNAAQLQELFEPPATSSSSSKALMVSQGGKK
jgi:hypothetical protein